MERSLLITAVCSSLRQNCATVSQIIRSDRSSEHVSLKREFAPATTFQNSSKKIGTYSQKPVEIRLVCRALVKEFGFFMGSSNACKRGMSDVLTSAIVSSKSFSEAMFGPLCCKMQVSFSLRTEC
jgi:hypothetical protein